MNSSAQWHVMFVCERAVPDPVLATVIGAAAGRAGVGAAGLRVLVVDDNRDAAETLAALLGLMGHVAPVANDGHQALRMMPGFRPNAVFLDIRMPGLSGYEVAAAIRKDPQYDGVTLVALTGFDLHLTKPATAAAIEAVLAR